MKKILHVEDDPDISEITRMALEGLHGFAVCSCLEWRDALEKCVEFKPDLLLLDVMMPGKTGPELLTELRRLPGMERTPAIFMTAKVQASEIEAFLAAGAIAVLTKPFDPMTLGDQIRAEWARHASAAAAEA
nr:response regulator [Meinhardsimonia xiamenensis]